MLAFGTYQVASHPRIAVILEGLRDRGYTVDEANVPLGLSTAQRVELLGSKTGAIRMLGKLAGAWSRLVVTAARTRRRARPDVVIVGYMGHFDVWLARLMFPRTTIVLDHLIFASTTATDRGVGDTGLKQRLLRFLDRGALTLADIDVVDTEEHRALVPESLRRKAVVVPVGASGPWYDAAAAAHGAPRDGGAAVSVVFFGLFTPLQGAETIGAAIGLLPGDGSIRVTMIGSGQDLKAARSKAQGGAPVMWEPWVDAAELPAVVASRDIGIGIMGATEKAAKVVPNKVYQCAAAGIAVVTSDTAPQRRAFGDAVDYVAAGDPEALADAIVRLARDPALLAARKAAAREAAESFRPEASVAALDERLSVL
ncbi:hypothetical protein AX769_18075 [Frondihabitans sp. PAMC 28766]|nr:hypothetical protein AX769_18075 [Frondihabitans sp. PAMC 28766]